MSGSIGADVVVGGDTSDAAGITTLEAVQEASTHVGAFSQPIGFFFNGSMLQYQTNVPFIATSDLYAAINASSTASALVTWSD